MSELLPGLDVYGALLLTIVGFGFVIFVHELGHFLAAKAVGIKVTQFAIGFGPAIFAWRKGIGIQRGTTEPQMQKLCVAHLQKNQSQGIQGQEKAGDDFTQEQLDSAARQLDLGETEYRLNWVPLGGYVKMLGQEDMDPTAISADDRAFNRKPVWARAIVISAGVTMNLIFGVIFFIAAFMMGLKVNPAIVGEVYPLTPADAAYADGHHDQPAYRGLRVGDQILSINGEPVTDFTDVAMAAALGKPDREIRLEIQRAGEPKPLIYKLTPTTGGPMELLWLGFDRHLIPEIPADAKRLAPILADAGVKPGMNAAQAGDQPIQNYSDYARAIAAGQGQPVPITFIDPKSGDQAIAPLTARPQLIWTRQGEQTVQQIVGLVPPTRIAAVVPDSPAQKAGIQPDDLVLELDGQTFPTLERIPQIARSNQGKPIQLAVLRNNERVDLGTVIPDRQGRIGLHLESAINQPVVGQMLPDSPIAKALQAPLPAGWRILKINGQDIPNFAAIQRTLQPLAQANPSGFTFELDYEVPFKQPIQGKLKIAADASLAGELARAKWDIPYELQPFKFDLLSLQTNNPVQATKMGFAKTHQSMLQVYVTLTRLVQGTVPVKGMQGPLGIFHTGTRLARQGNAYILFFFGLISANLVVINFLPIPIVDGGLMVFLLIEKLKGSPVHPKILSGANYVGLALIATVFLAVTYFDIMRLAGSIFRF